MEDVPSKIDYSEVVFTYEYDCQGFDMPSLIPNRIRATASVHGLSCVVDGPAAQGLDLRNMCYSRLVDLLESRCRDR